MDSWGVHETIDLLKIQHEFYVEYDEFDGPENIDEYRVLLRRAAKAAGMRVHTRHYDMDDALWVYDPDWKLPEGADPHEEAERAHAAAREYMAAKTKGRLRLVE